MNKSIHEYIFEKEWMEEVPCVHFHLKEHDVVEGLRGGVHVVVEVLDMFWQRGVIVDVGCVARDNVHSVEAVHCHIGEPSVVGEPGCLLGMGVVI